MKRARVPLWSCMLQLGSVVLIAFATVGTGSAESGDTWLRCDTSATNQSSADMASYSERWIFVFNSSRKQMFDYCRTSGDPGILTDLDGGLVKHNNFGPEYLGSVSITSNQISWKFDRTVALRDRKSVGAGSIVIDRNGLAIHTQWQMDDLKYDGSGMCKLIDPLPVAPREKI